MTQELKILIGIGVATLLVIIGAVFFLSGDKQQEQSSPEAIAENQEYLVRDNSIVAGSESAKVTLVEFSDFQCPACGAAYPAIEQIRAAYPDDLKFVYRHYPLPTHRNAKIAAYASEAANKQGKFWEMYSALFENQAEWSESNKPMEIFTTYAEEIGLDTQKFAADIKLDEVIEKVSNDQRDGGLLGVSATPTFFINGKPAFKGVPDYNALKQAIENELQAGQ